MTNLFFYYAFCSVKNQIKKLFKSWFIIFLAACILFGVILGFGIGFLETFISEDTETQEPLPDEEYEDITLTEDEIVIAKRVLEGAIGILTVVVFFFGAINADKSGSAIFTMPDVNLLFQAPKKPQSILLFKLMTQIFVMFFVSLYFLIEIPELVKLLGLSPYVGVAIALVWLLIIVYQKLLNVFLYTFSSTYVKFKRYLRPLCFGFLGIFVIIYLIMYLKDGDAFTAFLSAYSNTPSRFIPIWGWLKGAVMFAVEGDYFLSALFLFLLVITAVAAACGIWRIKADFYEDALILSEKNDAVLKSALEGRTAKREKERKDTLLRDGMNRGAGANVFFFKSIYNRRRFSYLGFFTKTSITYLLIMLLASIILFFTYTPEGSPFFITALALCAMVFFRSLGNPLAQDMDKACFVTIPASPFEKLLFSLLGGCLDTALDTLPALLVSALILRANPLDLLLYYLLLLAIDFYAGNVILFIEISLPSALSLNAKQMVSILFLYFGLVPIGAMLIVGLVFDLFKLFLILASAFAFLVGIIFFLISPTILNRGRK